MGGLGNWMGGGRGCFYLDHPNISDFVTYIEKRCLSQSKSLMAVRAMGFASCGGRAGWVVGAVSAGF